MMLSEAIDISYLMCKSKEHRLIPKYYILCSLVPPVKHYHVDLLVDDRKVKITCKRCNGFVKCSGRSVKLLYITFLHSGMSNHEV